MSYRPMHRLESLPEQDDENISNDPYPVLQKYIAARRKSRKRTPISPGSEEAPRSSRRNTSRYSGDLLDTSQEILGNFRSNRNINTSKDSGELLETSTASGDCVLQRSSDSLDGTASQARRHDKRYRICLEMYETEYNYLNMLKLMVNSFKIPLEQCVGHHNEIISKQEIAMLFSKIPNLINLHEVVCNELKRILAKWSHHSLVGRVWMNALMDAKKFYPPYINSYDEAINKLDMCIENKPAFKNFLREVESRPECQKNSLKDMLIRPVQRLPSVLLLLKELMKKTDKNIPDYNWIKECIADLEDALKLTNEKRAETETYTKFIEICNSIEGFPPEYIDSKRTFTQHVELLLLKASGGPWKSVQGHIVSFFLFNDFVAIAKLRSTLEHNTSFRSTSSAFSNISTMTLPRNSFLNFRKKERKQYKLVRIIRFGEFRDFDYYSAKGMFQMKLRDEKGDELCIFQVTDEFQFDLVVDFFNELIKMITTDLPNRLLTFENLTDEKLHALKNSRPEEYELFIRATKAAENYGDGTPHINRTSSLRRAVSNVSLSKISRGISRFASRSSLSKPNLNQSHYI